MTTVKNKKNLREHLLNKAPGDFFISLVYNLEPPMDTS